jgi:hypothetical protein
MNLFDYQSLRLLALKLNSNEVCPLNLLDIGLSLQYLYLCQCLHLCNQGENLLRKLSSDPKNQINYLSLGLEFIFHLSLFAPPIYISAVNFIREIHRHLNIVHSL